MAKTYKDVSQDELDHMKKSYTTFTGERLVGERPTACSKVNDVTQSVRRFEAEVHRHASHSQAVTITDTNLFSLKASICGQEFR